MRRRDIVTPKHEITFCNRAYAGLWYRNLQRQNPSHFDVLRAIIEKIEIKDGGDISKADIYGRNPQIQKRMMEWVFDIIPSGGQMLRHNGNGIRHAKYSPSKNIAVVWEKIRGTIYITFDDHTPVRYHRAISHLRDIRLGKKGVPKRAGTSGRFMKLLRRRWKRARHDRGLKGIDLKRRYYE
jgi:hypothetical protein